MKVEQQIVSFKDVTRLTLLSRSTINRLIKENKFPKPFKISVRRCAWTLTEVEEWIEMKKLG